MNINKIFTKDNFKVGCILYIILGIFSLITSSAFNFFFGFLLVISGVAPILIVLYYILYGIFLLFIAPVYLCVVRWVLDKWD
jgi:hypothetical protein